MLPAAHTTTNWRKKWRDIIHAAEVAALAPPPAQMRGPENDQYYEERQYIAMTAASVHQGPMEPPKDSRMPQNLDFSTLRSPFDLNPSIDPTSAAAKCVTFF